VRLGDVVTVPIQSDVLAMRVREQEKIRERWRACLGQATKAWYRAWVIKLGFSKNLAGLTPELIWKKIFKQGKSARGYNVMVQMWSKIFPSSRIILVLMRF
jgi:hypothetical protein